MTWTGIVAGIVRAFNLIAGWARNAGLRRRGAERAELEALRRRETVREKADEIDRRPPPRRDLDVLDRL